MMDSLYNLNLEQSVLATLLSALDGTVFTAIDGNLAPTDFYASRHQVIFSTICDLARRGEPFDLVMVYTELQETQALESVGGEDYLAKLAQVGGTVFNLKSYAAKIKALSKRRTIFNQLKQAQSELLNLETDLDEVWGAASSVISDVLTESAAKTSYTSDEAYEAWLDDVHAKSKQDKDVGVKTGFAELDKKLIVEGGDVVVIAARSGMGKTTFMQNIMTHVAATEDGVTVCFSIEMPVRALAARIYADKTDLGMAKAFTGKNLDDDDWDKILNGAHLAPNFNFVIDDRSTISTSQMRSFLNKLKLQHGKIAAVFVDYLQLIKPSNPKAAKHEQIETISGDLKTLAKDFNCPIFALSQLNRELERRPNKRPVMSDLRNSGAIEQDAATIIFLYRDEVYNQNGEHKGQAEAIIAKNRNAESATAVLGFDGAHSRFTNHIFSAADYEPFMGDTA